MFTIGLIEVEMQHQRREMLRQAEQRRLVREVKQAAPHTAPRRLSLNALVTAIRPVEVEPHPAPRVALKSR